jgi:hypothetical protein
MLILSHFPEAKNSSIHDVFQEVWFVFQQGLCTPPAYTYDSFHEKKE